MKYDEAHSRLSPEEFDRWLNRRIRRRSLFWMFVMCAMMGVGVLTVVWFCVEFVGLFCGNDSWPSGLFLAGLVLYCFRNLWRYDRQKQEAKVEEYEEEDDFEKYGYPAWSDSRP